MLEPRSAACASWACICSAGIVGSAASLAWNWRIPDVGPWAGVGRDLRPDRRGAVVGHVLGGADGRRFRNLMLLWAALLGFGLWVHADNAAHAGGFVAGLAVAWWLRGRAPSRSFGAEVWLILLVAGSFALASRHRAAKTAEDLINDGVAEARAGHQAQAMSHYRRALALEPENAVARYDLALALIATKEFAAAEREARHATEIDPQHRDAWGALAEAQTAQGRDAGTAYEQYQSLGGSFDGGAD